MKVLHIIDSLDVGGAERVAITLANVFAEKGHEIGMLILLPGTHPLLYLLNKNVKKYLLNRRNKLRPLYAREISSISVRYDIIHVHMRHNLRYLWFASYFGLIKWKKIFFHDHYGDIKNDKTIDIITKNIIRKSIYLGVSKELCKWAIKQCDAKKNYLLENIIIKEKIVKKQIKKTRGNRLILVSNIYPRKNIEFAIEIMYELRKEGVYFLDIIGQITERGYYNKLKKMIRSYGLKDFVNFNENCNNIQLILYNYDLALHTSKSEAGPLVLIEYLAQSLPFLTFSTGEVIQKLKEELQVLIVDSFNIQEWIKQIQELLQIDRSLIKRKMGEIYTNNYSSKIYYNRCLKIYQENLF